MHSNISSGNAVSIENISDLNKVSAPFKTTNWKYQQSNDFGYDYADFLEGSGMKEILDKFFKEVQEAISDVLKSEIPRLQGQISSIKDNDKRKSVQTAFDAFKKAMSLENKTN